MELKARVSGEGFQPTGNDGSDSWTDVTGVDDVSVSASVGLFLKEPVFDNRCMLSEWEWTW